MSRIFNLFKCLDGFLFRLCIIIMNQTSFFLLILLFYVISRVHTFLILFLLYLSFVGLFFLNYGMFVSIRL